MITDTAVLTRETCDRCGPYVAAQFRVTLDAGELTFCGHHTRALPVHLAVLASPLVSEFAEGGTE